MADMNASSLLAGISALYTAASAEKFVGPAGVLVALVGSVLYLTRSTKRSSKAPAKAAAACFDDPTLGSEPIFNPEKWRMIRISDSDFKWKEETKSLYHLPAEFNRDVNVNSSDYVFRGGLGPYQEPQSSKSANAPREGAKKGAAFFAHISEGRGCVPSDYGGPAFLLPGLIIAAYVSGSEARETILSHSNRRAMIAYILNHQQEDGGWGTHIAGTSTNFGSVLNYAALRLLGVRATHPRCCKARVFLAQREGALGSPLWAKLWLAVLGCYDYRGVSPVPPEMWLLPEWFPFHPGNTWCHARMVALPMSYLYGKRFVYPQCETDATVIQLRTELYPVGKSYHNIEWEKFGDHLCGGELYGAEPSFILRFGNKALQLLLEATWLGNPNGILRSAALKRAWKHICDEDITNNYIDIGPVNKALNLVCAAASGDAKALKNHIDSAYRYLWVAEDGMKMQGYLNSMVWDSSFTLLAVCSLLNSPGESTVHDARQTRLTTFAEELSGFLARNQVDVDPRETQKYRDPSKGGWGFSTKENTYIVSDCISEALYAVLVYAETLKTAPEADVISAVDLILWMQNPDDGAWASYEKRRGYSWYEKLNPAAIFGDIMIDYSYVECTSSCVKSLTAYIKYARNDPTHRDRVEKCKEACRRAALYLLRMQREDGSWFGQWGVCFTYASLFATEAIALCRELDLIDKAVSAKSLQKVAQFLLSKQDIQSGGWGESVDSCALKIWVPDPSGANVVNTAWAVMTLVRAIKSGAFSTGKENQVRDLAGKGAAFLLREQMSNGDWKQQQSISGVFNKTCGISYSTYRNSFPIWALAEYSHLE